MFVRPPAENVKAAAAAEELEEQVQGCEGHADGAPALQTSQRLC